MVQRVAPTTLTTSKTRSRAEPIAFAVMVVVLAVAPFFAYPLFLMQALCFALFACAFNLLIGYGGLLSFGHALYFGWASYISAHLAKVGTLSLPVWYASGQWLWFVIPLPPLPPELAILGGTAVACVLLFRRGIVGELAHFLRIRL